MGTLGLQGFRSVQGSYGTLSPVPPGSPKQFPMGTSPHDLQGASSLRMWVLPVPRPTCMSASWQLHSFLSHGSQGFMHCRQALYHTIPIRNSFMRLSILPASLCLHSLTVQRGYRIGQTLPVLLQHHSSLPRSGALRTRREARKWGRWWVG